MGEALINLSTLNDFVFCPYSIYLHNVYKEGDETLYHTMPQTTGRAAHKTVDNKGYIGEKGDECALEICSTDLGVMGKIDIYRPSQKLLIERKWDLKQIYKGNYYQIWGQYFCMREMGYEIEKLAFYVIKRKEFIYIDTPTLKEYNELLECINNIKYLNLAFTPNPNKCMHCIYSNLCDKTNNMENVYQ